MAGTGDTQVLTRIGFAQHCDLRRIVFKGGVFGIVETRRDVRRCRW